MQVYGLKQCKKKREQVIDGVQDFLVLSQAEFGIWHTCNNICNKKMSFHCSWVCKVLQYH